MLTACFLRRNDLPLFLAVQFLNLWLQVQLFPQRRIAHGPTLGILLAFAGRRLQQRREKTATSV